MSCSTSWSICFQPFSVRRAGIEQQFASALYGIPLPPLLYLFAGTIVGAGIALVMAHIAIGLALDQRWPTALASPAIAALPRSCTATTSWPSTSTPGIPYAAARLATLVFLVARRKAISVAYRLFSQT